MSVGTRHLGLQGAPRLMRTGLAGRLVDACCMIVGLLLAWALCAASLSALLMANAPSFKTRIPGPDSELLSSGAPGWPLSLARAEPAPRPPPAPAMRSAS